MRRSARPTQLDRLRSMLHVAGPAGVTQLEMMRPFDGGPPILALSQRIGDLKRQGVPVRSVRVRNPSGAWIARYVVTDDPSRGSVPGNHPSSMPCQASWTQPEEQTLVQSSTTIDASSSIPGSPLIGGERD